MNTYIYTVVQTIEVSALSEQEAREGLPLYHESWENNEYHISEETVDLIRVQEGESK